MLGERVREVERAAELDVGRDGGVGEGVEAIEPQRREHIGLFGGRRPEVAVDEAVGVAGRAGGGVGGVHGR